MPVSEIDIVGATGSSHSSHSPPSRAPLSLSFHLQPIRVLVFPPLSSPSLSLLFLAISLGVGLSRLTFHDLLSSFTPPNFRLEFFNMLFLSSACSNCCSHWNPISTIRKFFQIEKVYISFHPNLFIIHLFQELELISSAALLHLLRFFFARRNSMDVRREIKKCLANCLHECELNSVSITTTAARKREGERESVATLLLGKRLFSRVLAYEKGSQR